jgi:hypothetical protein
VRAYLESALALQSSSAPGLAAPGGGGCCREDDALEEAVEKLAAAARAYLPTSHLLWGLWGLIQVAPTRIVTITEIACDESWAYSGLVALKELGRLRKGLLSLHCAAVTRESLTALCQRKPSGSCPQAGPPCNARLAQRHRALSSKTAELEAERTLRAGLTAVLPLRAGQDLQCAGL